MAHRSCEDCPFNDGICILGHDDIYEQEFFENQCEDAIGSIILDEDDDEFDEFYQ